LTNLAGRTKNSVRIVSKVAFWNLGGRQSFFEPVDKIVGEHQEMEIELIGLETVGWDSGQGVTFFQLSDGNFDRSPGPIEIPDLFCSEREIGHKDLIAVTLQSEKTQLFGVLFGSGRRMTTNR